MFRKRGKYLVELSTKTNHENKDDNNEKSEEIQNEDQERGNYYVVA